MTDQSTIQCMLLFAKHAQSNSKNNWAADEFCYKLTIKTSRKEVGKIYGRLFVMAPNNSVWFLYKEHYIDFTNSSSVIVSKHVFDWNISKTKNWTRKCGFIFKYRRRKSKSTLFSRAFHHGFGLFLFTIITIIMSILLYHVENPTSQFLSN